MTDDEFHTLCFDIRNDTRFTDDTILDLLDDAVAEVVALRKAQPDSVPPLEIRRRLWLLGWLVYETSWDQTRLADSRFETADDEDVRHRGQSGLKSVKRVANAYRSLPWPEYAPRGLGAVRAEALVCSKKDTEQGYDEAWILHREAMDKYDSYSELLTNAPAKYQLALDETLIQLALAETGTACRAAERVLGRWAEGVGQGEWNATDEDRWIQRLFRDLLSGVEVGMRAIEAAKSIEDVHSLVFEVDEDRMALVTGKRNPGIMTARAALSAIPLCPEMQRLGRQPKAPWVTWDEVAADLLMSFKTAYDAIESPVVDASGEQVPLARDHARSVIQLRLHAAMVAPGAELPSRLDFADALSLTVLDAVSIAALTDWLSERETRSNRDGSPRTDKRGNANMIGSVTMPAYLRSVHLATSQIPSFDYLDWRQNNFHLDRYESEGDARKRVVDQVLTAARG